jgi:UDP-2-acetamido-3-amino-2,3-dideoxy-glucuronate N-acetyltransferase
MMESNTNSPVFIHPSAVVDEGAEIGAGSKIWHFTHIMSTAQLGNNCNLGQNVFVGSNVIIGSGVKIQNNVSIYSGVKIEDDCFLGPSMVFTNVTNPRSHVERKEEFKLTKVKKGCSIGANATIVCGVTLGEYSFVGAGTVVTKDVSDFAVVVGNPAKQIGWMSAFGEKLHFGENGEAICESSGDKYRLEHNQVSKLK